MHVIYSSNIYYEHAYCRSKFKIDCTLFSLSIAKNIMTDKIVHLSLPIKALPLPLPLPSLTLPLPLTLPTSTLSAEQQYVIDTVKTGTNVFISGPAGVGKSLVIRHIHEWATSQGPKSKIQVTALTGCASLMVGCGATTIHSWSGIRLGRESVDTIVQRIVRNKRLHTNWTKTRILVIDEVSMLSAKVFELLDRVGRKVRGKPLHPFGGIQLVLSGDFYQLSPIADATDDTGDSGRFCFESSTWNTVFPQNNQIQLTTIFRQTDPVFQALLTAARCGNCSPEHAAVLFARCNAIFDPDKYNGCQPTEIFPTRNQVDGFNNAQYNKLTSDEHKYLCIRQTDCKLWLNKGDAFTMDESSANRAATLQDKEHELEFMLGNAPCTADLKLKIGAAVMCVVNLDLTSEICNGSVGIVVRFTTVGDLPVVKFWNGVEMTIPMHWWQSPTTPCVAVGQIPLALSWAMTIHKTQGASLPLVKMDIGKKIFAEGQSYVALSRARSLDGLFLSSFIPERIRANPKVIEFYNSLPIIECEYEDDNEQADPKQLNVPEHYKQINQIEHTTKPDFQVFRCPE